MKKVAILGSTGSIGTQSLDVIRALKNIEVTAFSTNVQIELLEKQILEFSPKIVCVMDETRALQLEKRLKEKKISTKVCTGLEGLIYVASESGAELLITAVVGMIGLLPTIKAIKNGINIALANKETLVCAGELVMGMAKQLGVSIIPIDSEHGAIFECLQAGRKNEVNKLILTASGGPFRDFNAKQLETVTIEQALNHPNWRMGKKISIDSATLMNKALEVIEARFLFDVMPENIEVVIHKESIIHSMVEFIDGSVIAQMGIPDMRHPISYAINFPKRVNCSVIKPIDFKKTFALNFNAPNTELFPSLELAYYVLREGGTAPLVLNAANEVAVSLFLDSKIKFLDIPKLINKVLDKHIVINNPSLNDILELNEWARKMCYEGVV
ncbi:1-deoxy-D-xylulose-5-phosphate reductoisomerase [Candidatus Epulonipiscioides gigas]|nr:1-deoxy-D-xylulose-5-phosphate reductoisomerase [Epulopiscium sp. SCG-C07WGA-EpuloA2]